MNQENTPLFNALVKHSRKDPISFHVPGHKNGKVLLKEAFQEFENISKMDVTELTGLDDLHSPSEAIYKAEELLADHYQVKKSFFLVNGSTVGNLAMILASLREGDEVLVQRNCHKSIMNGLSLAKVKPIFISPDFDTQWQVASGISIKSIQMAINKYPNVKALIVTNPNYYGMLTNLNDIISYCHKHKIAVLVDEAHGAHFGTKKGLPPSAIEQGADIVVQSAHKSLPAMTMGSYMHFNSKIVELDRLKLYLRMLQSSSPSYPIMASLDLARKYIATLKTEDIEFTLQLIAQFKEKLNQIHSIKTLSYNGDGDPLKITIQSKTSLTGFEIQSRLEKHNVFTELADEHNVLFMFPLLKEGDVYPIEEVIFAINEAIGKEDSITQSFTSYEYTPITTLKMTYEDQQKREVEIIALSEANGRVCAESIVPYPPGIPFLLPGEEIRDGHIRKIKDLVKAGSRFQGGENIMILKIKVFKG